MIEGFIFGIIRFWIGSETTSTIVISTLIWLSADVLIIVKIMSINGLGWLRLWQWLLFRLLHFKAIFRFISIRKTRNFPIIWIQNSIFMVFPLNALGSVGLGKRVVWISKIFAIILIINFMEQFFVKIISESCRIYWIKVTKCARKGSCILIGRKTVEGKICHIRWWVPGIIRSVIILRIGMCGRRGNESLERKFPIGIFRLIGVIMIFR